MSDEARDQLLATIAAVPAGRVSSYGRIAELAGLPGKARWVGYVLKKLPHDSRIPWHRIINGQGKISFPQGSEKYQQQKSLLESEGVVFLYGRVSWKQFGWPDE